MKQVEDVAVQGVKGWLVVIKALIPEQKIDFLQ